MGYGKCKFVLFLDSPNRDPISYEDIHERLRTMYKHYHWSYLVMGDEICPKTGTPHVDGYYEQPDARKWTTENNKFRKFFSKGYGDLKIANGTAGENFDYSEKEGRYFEELGEPCRQGHKTCLKEASAAILAGEVTVEDIAVTNPDLYHQYGRTLLKLEEIYLRKQFRTEMPDVIWLYGATGLGKSHEAYQGYNPDTSYNWKDDNGWQDGYRGQKHIIINEFRGSKQIKFYELLKICDKWPYELRRRNAAPMPLLATSIVITSSQHPRTIFQDEMEDLKQLERRITIKKLE